MIRNKSLTAGIDMSMLIAERQNLLQATGCPRAIAMQLFSCPKSVQKADRRIPPMVGGRVIRRKPNNRACPEQVLNLPPPGRPSEVLLVAFNNAYSGGFDG